MGIIKKINETLQQKIIMQDLQITMMNENNIDNTTASSGGYDNEIQPFPATTDTKAPSAAAVVLVVDKVLGQGGQGIVCSTTYQG